MARIIAGVLIALLLWYLIVDRAGAHHNVYLPGVPNTPAIQNLFADGERTFCFNANAANYPNLIAQVQQTYDSQNTKLGNANRRITGTYESPQAALNAGCDVWWNGRYDNFCTGCAANVHYASWPVTVNMKLSLGYFEWKTTAGHEEGHIHGLHEQYIDSGGIQCDTSRTDTVMSCGTGVWELKPRDVGFICDLYSVPGDRFHACAPAPPTEFPFWTGTCWNYGYWCFNPTTGVWTDPSGKSEWQPWDAQGQEFNVRTQNQWRWTGLTTWLSDGQTWTCQTFCFQAP
jgi:hypothetical protein